jgi:predicted ATPase/class 3 adenylate cyclase
VIAMPPIPTGTVTFVFTDIEGSTERWQQDPHGMEAALARHHAVLQHAIESSRGYVFQIVGDAFCAAFATAPDAVVAAVTAQRRFAAEPWGLSRPLRVRMAIHTGTAEVRAGEYRSGEYVSGPTLNRVARLLAAAHGGQVLVSSATEPLVRDQLAADVALLDLGPQRLRDLPQPEHVFQVVIADVPGEFPRLRSLAVNPHNLPARLTTFVGRAREIAEVDRRLTEARLLTVTGAGGSGKTRLCLEVAADRLEAYPDGVWLAELGALSDPALVSQAVASAFGVREEAGRPLVDTLVDHLRTRHALLVLDNCEHMIDACVSLVDRLLRGCPRVSVLASSREPLGVTGELAFRLPSLQVPGAGDVSSLERLLECDAVRLFADRAAAAKPDFAVTADNARVLADICRRLDGIPLALELAAARVRALSLNAIAHGLGERFRLLTGGSRAALPRHQTLRGSIDWSYGLLAEPEAMLFRRLAVFVGGWTLDAAEAVCGADRLDRGEILDLVVRLVDRSLVVPEERNGDARYRLLETLRQYALEKLPAGELEPIRDRHRDFYVALAESAERGLQGGDQAVWLERIEADHDNVRAALRLALDRDDRETALRLGAAVWPFWDTRGHLREARDLLDELVRQAEAGRSGLTAPALNAFARVLDGAAWMRARAGEYQGSLQHLEKSLTIWRELDDKPGIAWALNKLGDQRRRLGDRAAARRLAEESLDLFRALSDARGLAHTLINLAAVAHEDGDEDRALALCEESVTLFRTAGDKRGLCHALDNLGGALIRTGRHTDAALLYRESLQLAEALDDWHAIATALRSLGGVARVQRDHAAARGCYEDSIARFRVRNDLTCLARSLVGLSAVCHAVGDHEEARARADEGLSLFRDTRAVSDLLPALGELGAAALACGDVGRATRLVGEKLLLHHELGDVAAVVETVDRLAEIAEQSGDAARAARLGDAARALRQGADAQSLAEVVAEARRTPG